MYAILFGVAQFPGIARATARVWTSAGNGSEGSEGWTIWLSIERATHSTVHTAAYFSRFCLPLQAVDVLDYVGSCCFLTGSFSGNSYVPCDLLCCYGFPWRHPDVVSVGCLQSTFGHQLWRAQAADRRLFEIAVWVAMHGVAIAANLDNCLTFPATAACYILLCCSIWCL
jgi:hypothetical protein